MRATPKSRRQKCGRSCANDGVRPIVAAASGGHFVVAGSASDIIGRAVIFSCVLFAGCVAHIWLFIGRAGIAIVFIVVRDNFAFGCYLWLFAALIY